MDARLLDFTHQALARGLGRAETERAMREAGWSDADVASALGMYADVAFPIPVPRPKPYLSARDVFVYLLLFTALYISCFNLGAIAFAAIDHYIPDPLVDTAPLESVKRALRWNIAYLVVAFPLFLLTLRAVARALARDPARRSSRTRRWLTYLTLFLAALILGGDVVVLVYSVLGGEFAVRFLLKAATVALLAGGVFAYFMGDVRQDEATP